MDVITGGELKVVVAIFLKDPYSGCSTPCESGSSCTHSWACTGINAQINKKKKGENGINGCLVYVENLHIGYWIYLWSHCTTKTFELRNSALVCHKKMTVASSFGLFVFLTATHTRLPTAVSQLFPAERVGE